MGLLSIAPESEQVPEVESLCGGHIRMNKRNCRQHTETTIARKEPITGCVQAGDEKQFGGSVAQGNPKTRWFIVHAIYFVFFFFLFSTHVVSEHAMICLVFR